MGNAYKLSELITALNGEGLSASYTFVLTPELHDMFEDISGSHNPLHTNNDFAKSKGFREKVGYGFLTCAMLSKMVGEYIPGCYGMCRSISCDFRKPVYIGDVLTYTGTLAEVRKSIRQIKIDVCITNQNDEIVATAMMQAGVSE